MSRDTGGNCGRRASAALALVIATAAASGCDKPAPPPEPLRPVRHERVYASGAARARTFSGTARAAEEIELSFRVPGKVERLAVRVGNRVTAGDLIAQLERTDYEIAKRQSQANLEQAIAQFNNARADLDRVRGLYESDNASRNELDQALAAYQSSDAGVRSSRETLFQAERRLEHASLRAPVEGAIAAVHVEVNENVSAGQPVVELTAGARPEVELGIPEVLIAEIREGDPVEVAFAALPGRSFDAVVTEVGVASTGAATTFPVTVRLVRPGREIRSGMAADVTFRFQSAGGGDRILLQAYAVGEDAGGRFVFRLEPGEAPGSGRVRRVSVEVAPELTPDGRLEILTGLAEGDDVVTAGVRRLSDGQAVALLGGEDSP